MSDLKYEVCEAAIQRHGSTPEAIEYCRGLFPIEAREIITRLSGIDPYRNAAPKACSAHDGRFGLSQWYFSAETIANVEASFGVSKKLSLCLGAPSFAGKGFSRSLLMDLDASEIAGSVRVDIGQCIGDELPRVFELCIADPPWYIEHYIHWMQLAAKFLKPNGKFLLPILGELTRPSAIDDRTLILHHARSLGFGIEVLKDYCRYLTPSFEHAILCRSGIFAPAWKRADLLVLTAENLVVNAPMERMPSAKLSSQVVLEEVTFEVVHESGSSAGSLLLKKPSGPKSHFMETPSSRDATTASSNVFTSNGFRFISHQTVELVSLLKRVQTFDELMQSLPGMASALAEVRDDYGRWFSGD